MQRVVKEAAHWAGVTIGGLAISLSNEIMHKLDSRAEQWVQDSIDVAFALEEKNVLLAFFFNNDLRNDHRGRRVVIDVEAHALKEQA